MPYLLLIFISGKLIYTDEFFFKSYSTQFSEKAITDIIVLKGDFWWVTYFYTFIIILLRSNFSAICIHIGIMFKGIHLDYKKIYKTTLISEIVFLVAQITHSIILHQNINDLRVDNILEYFPLSVLGFIGIENINAQWAIYPLQTANLFEVFYVIAIAWLLSKKWKPDFIETLNIVIPSYGLGLLLWVTLVAFLTLQVS